MSTNRKKRYIDFATFRYLAVDPSLNRHAKIDDPENRRAGKEPLIFADIRAKLPMLDQPGNRIADIGPGCDTLPRLVIDHAQKLGHRLTAIDAPEMLALLPDGPTIEKIGWAFPHCDEFLATNAGTFHAVIAYSVLHYVFPHGNVWEFLDAGLALLASGGGFLIGDVPNRSKRDRFLGSEAGAGLRTTLAAAGVAQTPRLNQPVPYEIDDAVIYGLIGRANAAGFDAYILPQPPSLPFADRRLDLLFTRP
jgi:hypothetical protein